MSFNILVHQMVCFKQILSWSIEHMFLWVVCLIGFTLCIEELNTNQKDNIRKISRITRSALDIEFEL